MLFTTHILAGAALGATTDSPGIAFGIGLVSHHLLDWIPHFDTGSLFNGKKRPKNLTPQEFFIASLDVMMGLGFLAIIWLTTNQPITIFWGAIGGVIPDLADNIPVVKDKFRQTTFGSWFHAFHVKFHKTLPIAKIIGGLAIQFLIIILSVWLIIGGNQQW